MNYKTPGVYVEEISKFPPSVAAVETAIPAFIGYTQRAQQKDEDDLRLIPKRITSLLEYERFFGGALPETGITVTIDTSKTPTDLRASIDTQHPFIMFYCLQAYFMNGGGPCYIVSVGEAGDGAIVDPGLLSQGLAAAGKIDEITLNIFTDALGLTSAVDYYSLQKASINQCVDLQDRFAVMDVWINPNDDTVDNVQALRKILGGTVDELKYGAVYYPRLEMVFDYYYKPADVVVTLNGSAGPLSDLEASNNALYNQARLAISQIPLPLPAAPVMAGIYARVDNTRGVWKAPANVGVDGAIRPLVNITHQSQESLNVDVTGGKSINAIRAFTGKGILVWGARTLAGNDNEWRYVSVRRYFNMVEESVKKATDQFVFEPNDANTWTKVRSMIENFLTLQWRAGALMGATPEKGFYVKVGMPETMDQIDILEGRMIVEIGLAVVRPAEFIILRFSHKMLEA